MKPELISIAICLSQRPKILLQPESITLVVHTNKENATFRIEEAGNRFHDSLFQEILAISVHVHATRRLELNIGGFARGD